MACDSLSPSPNPIPCEPTIHGGKCYLCVRYEVLPMSRAAHAANGRGEDLNLRPLVPNSVAARSPNNTNRSGAAWKSSVHAGLLHVLCPSLIRERHGANSSDAGIAGLRHKSRHKETSCGPPHSGSKTG